ncbi:guanine nucleotide exchange factor [Dipodascopsis uninucleata]
MNQLSTSQIEGILQRARNPETALLEQCELNGLIACACSRSESSAEASDRLLALKAIANSALLSPQLRAKISLDPYSEEESPSFLLLKRYAQNFSDDEDFVVGRILFLATLAPPSYSDAKSTMNKASEALVSHYLQHHIVDSALPEALAESSKFIFNLSVNFGGLGLSASDVRPLFDMLLSKTPHDLGPVTNPLISALWKLPFPEDFYVSAPEAEAAIDYLDRAVQARTEDSTLAPLLCLLTRLYSSVCDESFRIVVRRAIFTDDSERDLPLGTSDNLPSRLLKLLTDPQYLKSKELLYGLFWEASSGNASTFVYNIGFGFASGFLASNNIPFTGDLGSAKASSSSGGTQINPVTGQNICAESSESPFEGLTDEEKEREAERLFVLFERIRENGVLNVENPIRTAVESGRFEQLPD